MKIKDKNLKTLKNININFLILKLKIIFFIIILRNIIYI